MLLITVNRRNICVYPQYNVSFKLHKVINVFRLCKSVNIIRRLCVFPTPGSPSAPPQEEGVLRKRTHSEDQYVGLAKGETVTAVLEY